MSSGLIYTTTRVFWDLDDFPVPPGYVVDDIPDKIKSALRREGYVSTRADFSVHAYNKAPLPFKESCHFWSAGVDIEMTGEKKWRLQTLVLDMVRFALDMRLGYNYKPVNIMVIAKDWTEEDTGFFRHLEALEKKRFNVFLVVPDDCTPQQMPPLDAASLVWRWSSLCDGAEACPDSDDFDPEEDTESEKPNDRYAD